MNICGVCFLEKFKYKCPKCYIKYCSVGCYKAHTQVPCKPLIPVEVNPVVDSKPSTSNLPFFIDTRNPSNTLFPEDGGFTEDTVPPKKLKLLRDDAEVLRCLQNPHLRTLMLNLDKAEVPAKAIHDAMMEPIFLDLADNCLRVVGKEKTGT